MTDEASANNSKTPLGEKRASAKEAYVKLDGRTRVLFFRGRRG